jgi:hypothetical protein
MENQGTNSTKKQLSISEIISKLQNGIDREAIRLELGMKKSAFKRLMSHEKLKGVKVRRAGINDEYVLVDDTETVQSNTETVQSSNVVSESTVPTQPQEQTIESENVANESTETSLGESAYL